MQLLVKDFAAECGVSESIVYRHIRNHKDELGVGVIKKARQTWLTDEAQEYIRGLMIQQPIVLLDTKQSEIDDLKKEIVRLHEKLEGTQDALHAALQYQIEAQQAQARLEAAEKETKLLEGFIQDAKAEIRTLTEEKAEEVAKAQHEAAEAAKRAELAEAELAAYKALPWYKKIFG